jgi:DNA repair protein RadD
MMLRPYQCDVIADYQCALADGKRRPLVVAPTGSGKTIIMAAIIKAAVADRKTVLVLAHRREIVAQTVAKVRACGLNCGIIQAGERPRPLELVQVASIQTLWVRSQHAGKMELPPADLLVIDECHHAPAMTYRKIIAAYPDVVLLGLTATPCRGDGRGLGGIFEMMIECPQVAELIVQGYLVKTRHYAPVNPDLTGVRSQAGDYIETDLATYMDRPRLVGDIVTHWHKYGERRRTVAFAVDVGHSIHICDEFVKSGVRAEHIDGSTPKPERDAALARLASGETELISNCMVLTEGWDMPEVACCILARPTKKMGLYRQMVGRILRPASGKTDAIVLDHAGAVFRHGFVEDPVAWTLDPDRCAENRTHAARAVEHGSRLLECTQCSTIRVAGEPCPCCGFLPRRPGRNIDVRDGDLVRIDADLGFVGSGERARADLADPALRARWHGMLTHIAGERSYKPGWVAYKFKEKFNTWPPHGHVAPIAPSPEVRSWVRSRQIAYAKAKAKERAA